MAEWSRIVNTTISEYVRGEEINILRNRKLLDLMRSKGRLSFNHSGLSFVKRLRFKRAPMVGYADGDTLTFSRRDRWKTAELDWRGYSSTDAMTKKEQLMNKGTEAIVNVFSELAKSLMDDMNDQFGDELYKDGNATGNTKGIHGIESFMGAGSVAANGYIVQPSDTYANLRTDLGYYAGSWSTSGGNVTWPQGTGDASYDFYSPLLVSYTNASFAAATDNWTNNAIEALRYGIIRSKKNKTRDGSLDLIILDDELYRLFLGTNDSRQQVYVNRNEKTGLTALGWGDVINFEGVDITYEYGMPLNVGYGFNTMQMMLMSLQPTLFKADGPEYNIEDKSWRTSLDFFGNCWWNPRYFTKWYAAG